MSYIQASHNQSLNLSAVNVESKAKSLALPPINDISYSKSILKREPERRLLTVMVTLRDKLVAEGRLAPDEMRLFDEARQKLITHNTGFCYSMANKIEIPSYDRNDKSNVAVEGLYFAMESYQLEENVRFLTYAYRCVYRHLQNIRRIEFKQAFGRDVSRVDVLENKVRRVINELSQREGKYPTDDEIYAYLELSGVKSKSLCDVLRRINLSTIASLDTPQSSGDSKGLREETLYEIISDRPRVSLESENHEEINRTVQVANLKAREKSVILYRFNLADLGKMSLEDVGKVFSLTKERIRQIEQTAMKKLRAALSKRTSPELKYKLDASINTTFLVQDMEANESLDSHSTDLLTIVPVEDRPLGFDYEAPYADNYRVYAESEDSGLSSEALLSKYEKDGLTSSIVEAFTEQGYFCPNKGIRKKTVSNFENDSEANVFDKLYAEGVLQESVIAGIQKFRELPAKNGWTTRISNEDLKDTVLGWLMEYIKHPNFSRFAINPETTYWLLRSETK